MPVSLVQSRLRLALEDYALETRKNGGGELGPAARTRHGAVAQQQLLSFFPYQEALILHSIAP